MDIGIWQTHDDHAGHGYDRIYGLLKKSDDETICPLKMIPKAEHRR